MSERPKHVLIEEMDAGDVDDFIPKADAYMDELEAERDKAVFAAKRRWCEMRVQRQSADEYEWAMNYYEAENERLVAENKQAVQALDACEESIQYPND